MKKIKGILLDIDNTLYAYEPCHAYALVGVYRHLKKYINLREDQFKKLYQESRKTIQHRLGDVAASHHRLLYFQHLLESLGEKSFSLSYQLYEIYWREYFKVVRLNADAKSFLSLMQDKKICLLTDLTSEIQFRKAKHLKLDRYVDYIVTSEEVGVEKPHRKMFEAALKKINLKADGVIMIGDSFSRDIMGAVKLGIKSFWMVKYVADYRKYLSKAQKHGVVVCKDFKVMKDL